jgi:hypothetical protein
MVLYEVRCGAPDRTECDYAQIYQQDSEGKKNLGVVRPTGLEPVTPRSVEPPDDIELK